MNKQFIEQQLRAVPRLLHDDGDFVLPDYLTLTDLVWTWLYQKPDDMCSCGRSAFEAIGNDLDDHEKGCVVYLKARVKQFETVVKSCCDEPGLASWEIVNRLHDVL